MPGILVHRGHKLLLSLRDQRPAGVGPLERLGHGPIEVVDEIQDPLFQVVHRSKTSPFEQAPHQDTKPQLDLIQPGSMLGGVDKANRMVR